MSSGIPEPNTCGVSGTQQSPTGGPTLIDTELVESPLDGLTIASAVQGLATSHARSFGGEVGARLLAGSFADMQRQFFAEKRDHADTRSRLEQVQTSLTVEKINSATLSERLRSCSRTRHFSNIGVAIGCAIIGFGIQLLQSPQATIGGITLTLGLIVVIFCFLLSEPEPKK